MQNEPVETFEVKGLTVKIFPDDDVSSPREDENFGHMVCFHRRYNLGDKREFSSPSEFQEWAQDKANGVAVILPLFLYDHSGISVSTSTFVGRSHHGDWDSGQVGWTWATFEDVRKNWNVKRVSKKSIERATALLVAEVETYDQFLTGQVYGYVVETPEGEHLDSCWGFYGEKYVREAATEAATEYQAKEQAKTDDSIDKTFAL